jgi:pimeloyl-ACP methyl ester carboxylesterase
VILPDLRGHGDRARPHDRASYPPDVLADDGLALIDWLGLGPGDYDLGGYSAGGKVVPRMLARGARPARAIVGGQGIDAMEPASERTGGYRRVLAAMVNGDAFAPGTTEASMAQWITEVGADPLALSLVLDTFTGTSPAELQQVPVPTLILVGDQDQRGDSAAELAALLPGGRSARVPGDHFTAMSTPEFVTAIIGFLGDRLTVTIRMIISVVMDAIRSGRRLSLLRARSGRSIIGPWGIAVGWAGYKDRLHRAGHRGVLLPARVPADPECHAIVAL